MSIELTKLASQGRAYSAFRAWTPEENDFLYVLIEKRGLSRVTAADYVRNGIMSIEAYDAAVEQGFKPKTLEDARTAADAALKDNEFADAESGENVSADVPDAAVTAPRSPKKRSPKKGKGGK